jgi:SAM-dependent methyltransferase
MSPAPAVPDDTVQSTTQIQDYYRRIVPYLDRELADRGDGELWAWAAGTPEPCRVLELGCGTGRATAFLAHTAAQVIAVDLSPALLALARQRLGHLPHVHLLAGDLRELPLGVRFDLVVAVDDPLVHLLEDADRDRAFAAAARHLAPGDRFLLDAAWLTPSRRQAAEQPDGLVEQHQADGGLAVRETWRCDRATRTCSTRFDYELDGAAVASATFPGRLWSLAELEHRCRRAGLRLTRLWGDYDRRPWDRDTSPRLIAEMKV